MVIPICEEDCFEPGRIVVFNVISKYPDGVVFNDNSNNAAKFCICMCDWSNGTPEPFSWTLQVLHTPF